MHMKSTHVGNISTLSRRPCLLIVILLVSVELYLGVTHMTSISVLPTSFSQQKSSCSSLECSLNGCLTEIHLRSSCQCRKPWSGPSCSTLLTKSSPPSAKSLFESDEDSWNNDGSENSWSGPIYEDAETKRFHMYMAVYPRGNLATPHKMYHGISSEGATGPYQWTNMNLPRPPKSNTFANPGFLHFVNSTTKKSQYALFFGNQVFVEDSLDFGTFTNPAIAEYPHINFSPIYHNQSFYAVFQTLNYVYVTVDLTQPWQRHGVIEDPHQGPLWSHSKLEDPFLWIDEYGNWHIVGHAFDKKQRYNCSQSMVSAHLYSQDGKKWYRSQDAPYGHTIHYTDGTSQVYSTLERPYVVFNTTTKRPTHIILAASLEHGDEGCAHTKQCANNERFCSCVNCKWIGRAGTVVLSLDDGS